MRYLKSINEFNSNVSKPCRMGYDNEETDCLVQTIKDICIELEDEGFSINVSKMVPKSDQIFVRIQWKEYKETPDSSNLKDIIERIRDLMKISEWFEKDTEDREHYPIDKYLSFTKEKEKEYVTFGDGVAHTNF